MTQSESKPPFLKEFPNFPPVDFPPTPKGFEDTSWHNDACPSITSESARLAIYIDYSDPAKKEHPDAPRFVVQALDAEGQMLDKPPVLTTEKWQDVLDLIRRPLGSGPQQIGRGKGYEEGDL